MTGFLLLHYADIPDPVLVNMALVEIAVEEDGGTVLHYAGGMSTLTVSESLLEIASRLGAR